MESQLLLNKFFLFSIFATLVINWLAGWDSNPQDIRLFRLSYPPVKVKEVGVGLEPTEPNIEWPALAAALPVC